MVEQLQSGKIARVPGSAVFFTRYTDQTPPVMVWHVRQNRALHETVLALTLTVLSVPWTDPEERLTVARVDDKFWRAEARRGFMEHPDIPGILDGMQGEGRRDRPRRRDLLSSAAKPSCRARTGRAYRAGRRRFSPRWAATPSASATISTCPATTSSRSGAKSRFEALAFRAARGRSAEGLARGVRFRPRLNLCNALGALFRPSVACGSREAAPSKFRGGPYRTPRRSPSLPAGESGRHACTNGRSAVG